MGHRICTEPTCNEPRRAVGFCMKHYDRMRRRGTTADVVLRPIRDRFWSKVDKSGDCWIWTGSLDGRGYGEFYVRVDGADKKARAHRWAYEDVVGPIPDGLHLDHVCHTNDSSCRISKECPHKRCVNPSHLEPVTPSENVERARDRHPNAAKTHCPQGHPYEGRNVIRRLNGRPAGSRGCRTCAYDSVRRYQARKKREAAGEAA